MELTRGQGILARPKTERRDLYKRILLAYDGSLEGRTALREGALMAHRHGAAIYLLSVVSEAPGIVLAEGGYAGAVGHELEVFRELLQEGAERLAAIGMAPAEAELVVGEPAVEIGAYAKRIKADMVVVGHRKKGLLERWWSGSVGANLLEFTTCSLLVSRNPITEEDFWTELRHQSPPAEGES